MKHNPEDDIKMLDEALTEACADRDDLDARLEKMKIERDDARRMACWQYARRNGKGDLSAERYFANLYDSFNGWNCFEGYDWSKYAE